MQAELATLACPQIGAICSVSEFGDPIIGKLAAGELMKLGPFSRAFDYFTALGNAAANNTTTRLGAFIFLDIVETTDLFGRSVTEEFFPFNHMDLGTQNILVDEHFNFVAIIDWEFAQTVPWQVIHYPMPFPLLSPTEDILRDPNHIAYSNVCRQDAAQKYMSKSSGMRSANLKVKAGSWEGRSPLPSTARLRGYMPALQISVVYLRLMKIWYMRWHGLRLD